MILYSDARILGSIARLNNMDRVPLRDKKLMDQIRTKTTRIMHLYMREWLSGYDEVNFEYKNIAAQEKFENLNKKVGTSN